MKSAKITGTFVDFSELTHKDHVLLPWSTKEWVEEMRDMVDAGIDTVIIARTMRYGAVYYYSNYYETHLETDVLTPFMEAAEETGLKVYISGMISDHFFNADDVDFSRMMKRDINIYSTVISELVDLYGNHPGLSGIYISHEADNVNMRSAARRDAARDFFGTTYAAVKKIKNLPIMSSPFFTKSSSPNELAEFWDAFLDRPMFDILAMQDGIGCDRDVMPEDIPAYYSSLEPVFKSRKIRFWNNVETFTFNPGFRKSGNDRSKIWLKTAPLGRVAQQFEAGTPFVEKTITWEYGHFLGRKQAGNDFYNEFRRWNLQDTVEIL